jgi:hypothetical protein
MTLVPNHSKSSNFRKWKHLLVVFIRTLKMDIDVSSIENNPNLFLRFKIVFIVANHDQNLANPIIMLSWVYFKQKHLSGSKHAKTLLKCETWTIYVLNVHIYLQMYKDMNMNKFIIPSTTKHLLFKLGT